MIRKTLWHVGWRYLLRHPWQSALMILGITLGVAVVIAVDIANASASRAFDLSTDAVAGKATHQITGGPQGIEEDLYTQLRLQGSRLVAAPVLTEFVSSNQLGGQPLQMLGVDPFAEPPFRSYLGQSQNAKLGGIPDLNQSLSLNLTAFFVEPGAVMISSDIADRYGLQACKFSPLTNSVQQNCQIELQVSGRQLQAHISGLIQPVDRLSRRALDGLILVDIATAQELTGRLGKLDRIDLILAPDCDNPMLMCASDVQELLPEDVQIRTVSARAGTVEQMTAAFRINLIALSLLALVVGMFLIYNTMTFSVVQRRPLFGTLRCLGVTRSEVFWLIIGEALLVGILGAILGSLVGILLGQGAVRLVTQTINDLFFVLTVRGVQIPIESLGKGALLGTAVTIITAALPAWEAASVAPRLALSRSGLESKANRAVKISAIVGAALILLGIAILLVPTRNLVISFSGTFAIIVGLAMLVPISAGGLMRAAIPGFGRLLGTLGRMAPRGVASSISRTSIAMMALMVAVSVTIGVSLMVSSFRYTVQTWLSETLQGDIYISAPGLTATTPSISIDQQTVQALRNRPGVSRADVLRSVNVDSPQGMVHIAATDNFTVAEERVFLSSTSQPQSIWVKMQSGQVLVSEPFANRLGLPRQGGSITLLTERGPKVFPVAGIYYDYASSQGTVLMSLDTYQKLWNDTTITAIALRLNPDQDVDRVVQSIQSTVSASQRLLVRPNRELRNEVLEVFDRTFSITGSLQILATVVAFIGVLSALLSLELERQRELGILRAVGMTVRQLWSLILMETGLMGAVAGLLAMPTGYILAIILVYIINRRSFGWTLQLELDWLPFLEAFLVAVLAALLAGLYPAYRMGKMITSEALRSE